MLTDVHVPTGQWSSAEPGEMVLVEITRWPTRDARAGRPRRSKCSAASTSRASTRRSSSASSASPTRTPRSRSRRRRGWAPAVKERDIKGRTDFRGVTTVTIDGEHARDFDDAITIERLPNGHYWLGVHIADVSHYVKEGSALDEEAYERGTSVYFTERAVHMFPAELATGLCSLNPHVDRLVQSCLMEVDRRGNVVRYEMHDGVINSDARMTYTAVNAILTDRDRGRRCASTRRSCRCSSRCTSCSRSSTTRRRRRGSIDFDLPEAEVILSELRPDRGHRRVRAQRGAPADRRVHAARERDRGRASGRATTCRRCTACTRRPTSKKVADFEEFITTLGYSLAATGRTVTPKHFQKLIDRIRGTPEERPIAALMLRTMQKARYDAASLGHFGLAAEHYTHFTSPIRRYPDLVVHRMLRESRHGAMTPARREELDEELPEIAKHTSEMERRADEAERELLQWKKVRFMADKVGDEYEGYITGVAPFGLFIELSRALRRRPRPHLEHGRRLLPVRRAAAHPAGENTKKVYRLGDKVRVQVVRVDMERRQVDLGLVEILERVRTDERARGPHRSRVRTKKSSRVGRGTAESAAPGRRERQARKGRGPGRGGRR